MSDMRDFGTGAEPGGFKPVEQDFSAERIDLEGEGLENSDVAPLSADSGLGDFHTAEPEASNGTGKLVGALAVALIVGGAGAFAFTTGMHTQKPVQNAALPHPAPPTKVAAAPPPAPPPPAPDISANSATPDNAGQTAPVPTARPSAPVKTARAHIRHHAVRSSAEETPAVTAPEQSAAAQPVTPAPQQSATAQPSPETGPAPEPVSPAAPPSSYANNNAPAPTATPNGDAAQDMPSPRPVIPDAQAQTPAPQPAPAAPAQPQPDQADQQPAAPQ
jgi:hypothetical protein